jgi:glutathione S-transferase
MITLYELHWSHYCEKIRWALDFKKLVWRKVNINAFSKSEINKFPCNQGRHLVPLIHDEINNYSLGDSSPILLYLEKAYPDSPLLLPAEESHRKLAYQWMIELDSKLGIVGRKLGYTQLILEKPVILSKLFLSDFWNGVFALPILRRISSALLGMMLIKRFHLELNESRGLYDELEEYLLSLAKLFSDKKYLIGDEFTLVDLTLAVYLRPLTIIPFFYENPKLQTLFQWQESLLKEHNREEELLYQKLIRESRNIKPPVRRKIVNSKLLSGFMNFIDSESTRSGIAFNDQEAIWTWKLIFAPYYYFFKLRKNKIRQKLSSSKFR